MESQMLVVKASGKTEPFAEDKLRRSLERSRASEEVIQRVVNTITQEFKSGSHTKDIYRRAFSLLRKYQPHVAARYSLKRAIMELGPEGHPFENLVGEIFKAQGYTTNVSVVVQGECVSHEVDVVAQKERKCLMVECKFHNQQGTRSDVKVALYVQARFEDIKKRWQKDPSHGREFHEAWLVTNTQLTSDAIQYASCVGMRAVGWNHPAKGNLQNLIEESGLHPFTCLTTLSGSNKRALMDQGVSLCKDVIKDRALLKRIGLNDAKIAKVEQEIEMLCRP
ncbi:MAG: restriction endonuclease [bacterium]|nr:restriction endonuclease [bacterium]